MKTWFLNNMELLYEVTWQQTNNFRQEFNIVSEKEIMLFQTRDNLKLKACLVTFSYSNKVKLK